MYLMEWIHEENSFRVFFSVNRENGKVSEKFKPLAIEVDLRETKANTQIT